MKCDISRDGGIIESIRRDIGLAKDQERRMKELVTYSGDSTALLSRCGFMHILRKNLDF